KRVLSIVYFNIVQVCTLSYRTIIPVSKQDEFINSVKENIDNYKVGSPEDEESALGPVMSKDQYDRVQSYIQKGIDEGATLVTGGLGKPEGLETGYYVQPTVFADVDNQMTIAQEEIFGPVMSIITYISLDNEINIYNNTIYSLADYVIGNDKEKLTEVAKSIRAGRITVNKAPSDYGAPFGGFKQSGIGREWGAYGIEEYLEVKSIIGLS